MTYLGELEKYVRSSNTIVSERAMKIKELYDAKSQGLISKSEYNELVEDLLDIEKVDKLTSKIQEREMLITLFNAMLLIAKNLI